MAIAERPAAPGSGSGRNGGFVDPLTATLAAAGPKAGATSGDPVESFVVLSDDGRTEVGVWECTPGAWTSAKVGLGELMSFVAGHGWIVDEVDGRDGPRHEIRPGLVRWFPDGWRGRWEVDETVRKTYAIVRSDPATGSGGEGEPAR